MSDTVFSVTAEELDPERQRVLEMRRANLAKARAAKGKNSPGRPPASGKRQAEVRTATDAARAGVGSDSRPAERAQSVRESAPQEVITRVRRDDRDSGWADLPKHSRKPGWDYEYKTIRVYNEPVDPGEMLEIRNAGWRPEKAIDWPDLVEPGASPDAPIERRGQRLYGRPMRLTQEARQEDLAAAYQQQRDKTMAAASGKSAVRGEDGIPNGRGVRSVPISVEIEGLAG